MTEHVESTSGLLTGQRTLSSSSGPRISIKFLIWKERGQGLEDSSFLAKKPKVKEHTSSPWEKPTLLSIACSSLTRLAVARATNKMVFCVRFLREAELNGSKGGLVSHLRTTSKFQDTKLDYFCLEVSKDLMRSLRSWLEERSIPLCLNTVVSTARYPLMVDEERLLEVLG